MPVSPPVETVLDGLNTNQARAVTAPEGPLLIVAGAGTGKTTVLTRRIAYLIAANSEGGRRMLGRHHSLRIGEQGIVGYVAARGESRVARNVGEDIVFFNNPDLPATRSEAALPLKITNRIIGVLDVQSTKEDAFRADDLRVLAHEGPRKWSCRHPGSRRQLPGS